jgi:hypothetical protein
VWWLLKTAGGDGVPADSFAQSAARLAAVLPALRWAVELAHVPDNGILARLDAMAKNPGNGESLDAGAASWDTVGQHLLASENALAPSALLQPTLGELLPSLWDGPTTPVFASYLADLAKAYPASIAAAQAMAQAQRSLKDAVAHFWGQVDNLVAGLLASGLVGLVVGTLTTGLGGAGAALAALLLTLQKFASEYFAMEAAVTASHEHLAAVDTALAAVPGNTSRWPTMQSTVVAGWDVRPSGRPDQLKVATLWMHGAGWDLRRAGAELTAAAAAASGLTLDAGAVSDAVKGAASYNQAQAQFHNFVGPAGPSTTGLGDSLVVHAAEHDLADATLEAQIRATG